MKSILCIATAFAAFCATTAPAAAAKNHLAAAPARGISLRIATEKKMYASGSAIPVHADFLNHGNRPFAFLQYPGETENTFICAGTYGRHGRPVQLTLFGHRALHRRAYLPREWYPPNQIVASQKSSQYCSPVPVGRYLDMTLPGEYHIRLTSKYGIQSAGSEHAWNGALAVGPHFRLIQDGDGSIVAKGVGLSNRISSNWLKFRVTAPYRRLPALALTASTKAGPKLPQNVPIGIHIVLTEPDVHGPGPIGMRAKLVVAGRNPVTRRLTGNPFADFGKIEITGPSYPGEFTVVKLPKPHDVAFIRKSPTPLTAYGQWLAKHPVKGLKWRTYALKPGVVYRYAVPVNLSCLYDMSLAGVYRVRMELARTHIWSPWANVTVP